LCAGGYAIICLENWNIGMMHSPKKNPKYGFTSFSPIFHYSNIPAFQATIAIISQ
jgi:hypothetical protein